MAAAQMAPIASTGQIRYETRVLCSREDVPVGGQLHGGVVTGKVALGQFWRGRSAWELWEYRISACRVAA